MSDNVLTAIITAIILFFLTAVLLALVFATRGCAEIHERKIRIEFMPEDAPAVRKVLDEKLNQVRSEETK